MKGRFLMEMTQKTAPIGIGTLVTVKQPYPVYSIRAKGGRWLELRRPAIDHHSPQPGEPAIITEIAEGRYGNQYHVSSLAFTRSDWFSIGDFELLEVE